MSETASLPSNKKEDNHPLALSTVSAVVAGVATQQALHYREKAAGFKPYPLKAEHREAVQQTMELIQQGIKENIPFEQWKEELPEVGKKSSEIVENIFNYTLHNPNFEGGYTTIANHFSRILKEQSFNYTPFIIGGAAVVAGTATFMLNQKSQHAFLPHTYVSDMKAEPLVAVEHTPKR